MRTAHSLPYMGGLCLGGLPGHRPPVQRFTWTETSPDRDLLGQRPPWTETPLDRDPLGQRPPWTETPLDRDPWIETPLDRDPATDRQKLLKTLPCLKIRLLAVNIADIETFQVKPNLSLFITE